jgi:hypothetical protein
MTTDKLSAGQRAEVLRLVAPYLVNNELFRAQAHADRIEAEAFRDEAARRERAETRCAKGDIACVSPEKCELDRECQATPAPPADERAELVEILLTGNINKTETLEAIGSAAALIDTDGARIAELERERDEARARADRRFEEYVKQGEELRAANARAEAAEAREKGLREAAKAYRQAEQDYVFMAERPDEEYVPADVHLARMHMHRAAAALDAAISQKEPGNG